MSDFNDNESIREHRGLSSRLMSEPIITLGMLGFFGVVGYNIYRFRRRPAGVPITLYVVQARVYAQSVAVGSVLLVVAAKSWKKWREGHTLPAAPLDGSDS